MKCAICRHGATEPGKITVVLSRGGTTLVFKDVPAMVCANCGEEYITEQTSKSLLNKAGKAQKTGVELELLKYAA